MCAICDIYSNGGNMSKRERSKGQHTSDDDLRRSPVAWLKFFGLIAFTVIVPAILITAILKPSDSGNPRRNLSATEEARQVEARADAQYYRKQQRHWIERVAAGEVSFGEADCEFDRGGEWDSDRELCRGGRHRAFP
jgi:hypothetical protein